MLRSLAVAGIVVLLSAPVCLSSAGDGEQPAGTAEQVLTVALREVETTSVALKPDSVIVTHIEEERHEIPVALSKTAYEATLRPAMQEESGEWSAPLTFYELRSTDPNIAFTWVFCTDWPVHDVFLLRDENQAVSYWALSTIGRVFFIEIREPRDATAALTDFFLRRDSHWGVDVPIRSILLSGWPSAAPSPLTSVVLVVEAITAHPFGWIVKLRAPDSDRIFTHMVGSDGYPWY